VRTIVALIHEGGVPVADGQCVSGPIRDIVERTSPEVDVFMTGHTHQIYNCVVDGRPVTSAGSFGRLVTDVTVTIDRRSGQTRRVTADNLVVTRDVAQDPAQTALIARYKAIAGPIGDRVIGQAAADITRAATPAGESALGDVIADSQLEATSGAAVGGAQIALMNPGGIRADLAAGPVTFAEAFTVQPFGNNLVTMTLTGAQIERVLEQQVWPSDTPDGSSRILQVSNGFAYTWEPARPAGDRVDPATITLNGAPLVPTTSYRVTVNNFLADGGDGFTVLREGTDRLGGAVDLDALEAYFAAHVPVAPGPRNRILRAGA
jgi:5'-nucleotidase